MKNKEKVPKLRFPEFNKEWKRTTLGEVSNYEKGFAFKSKNYSESGTRIIRVSDLGTEWIKDDNPVYIDKNKSQEYDKYRLNKGNIIVTTVGSRPEVIESAVGKAIYIRENNQGLLNQNMLKLIGEEVIADFFLMGFLKSRKYKNHIKVIARGNANQSNITVKGLLEFKILIPHISEQQRIADFLSSVDQKIQQLRRKKELLEEYKKDVMQKLFPSADGQAPELRFKDEDGNPFPDWETKKLKDVAEVNPRSGDLPENFFYINLGSVEDGRLLKEEETTLSEAPSRAQRLLDKGDILFQTVRPYQKNNYLFEKDGEYVASSGYAQLRARENKHFLFHLLHHQPLVNLIIRWSTGSSFPAISASDLADLPVPMPSVKEQKRIADFLNNISIKIHSIEKQITKTQTFKKGLLQQMFV